jgi:glycerophosphoryl diester phosphodiesterase
VPTLAEALELLRERAQVLIEIKREASSGAPDGVEARTIAAVHKAGVAGEVALACFDPAVLQRCRACDPSVARAHLFHRAPVDDALGSAAAVAATFILPEKGMLSPELVERASAAGLRVATWLIDDPDELLALKPYALYGVGTNRPAAMLEALAEA